MTKVKVKGSFLSKPPERARPAAEHFDDDDDDEEEDEEARFAGKSNYMPFVQANNKGKRGPRGAGRYSQKDSSGFQSSDSALGTSSGDDGDDDDDVGDSTQDRHGSGEFGYEENSASDLARRGSVRVKVKPSKFREKPSQSHDTPDERSHIKKRPASTPFESSSSRHPFSVKDYTSADRQQDHLTNELRTALMVVRKIMKMEAAEPFNIPVDPIALGIPDYFDIVKRPMDLGTICKNLERGGKYRSSRDVYEDVQLVWTNCRIYNQKGDPILELLSRVKKNFMKYWTAAGLYTEKSPATFKFQGRSPEVQPREMQEDFDFGRSKKMAKYMKEEDSPANSTAKLNSFEQSMIGSKAAKPYPEDFAPGFRRDQEVASSATRDDLDSFYLNREGPKIISVYKAHKKKKLEQPDNEQSMETGPKGFTHEGDQKSVGRGLVVVKQPHVEKSNRQKEADLHGTPVKSRRVSGTGHHKADCSCVVCTGVRRKLAREGRLGSPLATASTMSAESPSERILVRLKTEGGSDRHKSSSGAKEGRENYKAKEERANLANNATLRRVKHDDSDNNGLDADREKASDRGGASNGEDNKGTGKEGLGTDGNKGSSESDAMLESAKGLSEEGIKGAGDEIEDKDDALLNDEQLADMLDAETERQEGGVRYYRASYEMPLRKMNPSILEMSQRLFGSSSPWNHGRALGRRPPSKACSENPIFSTVSALLSTKGT